MPAGKCANCDAAVSYFARGCAHCGLANQPNAVTTVAALGLLIALGVAIFFAARALPWTRTATQTPPQTTTTTSGPKEDDYGWVVQAMAECDVYAKESADTLHFLLVPLTPSGKRVQGWDPGEMGRIGRSTVLVPSTDALIGLRNGVFLPYRKPVTFAVRDEATRTIYKWKPTTGVSELKSRQSGFESLALGLQVGDSAEIDWGPTFKIVKGTCYWTNPVIGARASGNSPPDPAPQ